jgi:hypothetical protein
MSRAASLISLRPIINGEMFDKMAAAAPVWIKWYYASVPKQLRLNKRRGPTGGVELHKNT